MTYFVTGATGFIGSAVVRALLSRHTRIRAFVRRGSDRSNIEGLPLEIVEGDLRDPGAVRDAMRGCDAVFHIAADYRHWTRHPEDLLAVNVGGTQAVLDAMHATGISRLVYTSSVGAMGLAPGGIPAGEDTPAPYDAIIGHYHRSKYLAAQCVLRSAGQGLNATIVSPTMPLGPRDIRPTPTGRIIVEAANGRLPAYVDTGFNIVHVEDVAQGHLLALDKGARGANYILGGQDVTLRGLLTMVGDMTGANRAPVRIPLALAYPVAWGGEALARITGVPPLASLDEVRLAAHKMYFSSARAMRELDYRPRPAREAVRDSIEWFERHGRIVAPRGLSRGVRRGPTRDRSTARPASSHLKDL